jgi:outer membrane protein assembly factor BamA
LPGKPFSYFDLLKAVAAIMIIFSLGSCITFTRFYPEGKPYVRETNINVVGNFSNRDRKELEAALHQQLDDSMVVRLKEKLAWKTLRSPKVFDSSNADNSIVFMRALLKSQGYFNDSIYYTTEIHKPNKANRRSGKKIPIITNYYVKPGKLVTLDTVFYNMGDYKELQRLAIRSSADSAMVKKGSPFAKAPISAELDRLTELYRNNGYLRFTRDELVGIWDTLDVSLLRPTFDPFEQLEILQKLKARRDSPTASLEIKLKNADSSKLVKYYVGKITVYPDVFPDYEVDTVDLIPSIKVIKGITVIQYYGMFKPKIFPENIFLIRDSVYTQRRFLRTINQFNGLGTWRLVSVEPIPRKNEDTVDFVIKLSPDGKYVFDYNIETSINQSNYSGNLFGIGANVSLQNKNFLRSANLSVLNLGGRIELGYIKNSSFIQSKQVSLNYSIYFPRLIPNFRFVPFPRLFPKFRVVPERWKDNLRTVLSFNATNTERRLLYNLTTLNAAWAYQYQRRNIQALIKLPNIEYSYLLQRDSLDKLIAQNPSLRNIFTDGFISSVVGNFTVSSRPGRININGFRANLEVAGVLVGLIRNRFFDSALYRFVKFDAEFTRLIRFTKSSIALRAFWGIGYELNGTVNERKRNNLPFFKQYFSGGPNSMRAWGLRRLGPGATVKPYFGGTDAIPDRYGDLQLEANIEYRFPIATPFGAKLNGAVFTDIGNVWFLKKKASDIPEEVFKLSRLGQDIAIGAGIGLRLDLNFIVLRFDYSYKVKDPSPSPDNAQIQNKWFGYRLFAGDQFQLGIGYPFIF